MSIDKRSSSVKTRTFVEHVLKNPGMFIGSCSVIDREDWSCQISGTENGIEGDHGIKFIHKQVQVPEGLMRIFLEILQNATDNAEHSRKDSIDPGIIKVTIEEDGWISIYNEGKAFPTGIHKTERIHIPEMTFTKERTSSNYDDNASAVIGQNGYGAKLTSILCDRLKLDIGDDIMGTRYTQEFSTNMSVITKPKLRPYKGAAYTKVSYLADFKRFGMEYDDDFKHMALKACIDASYSQDIVIHFNDIEIDYRNPKAYSLCLMDNPRIKSIEWDFEGDGRHLLHANVRIFDLPSSGFLMSLVNGTCVKNGGTHSESIYKAVCAPLMEHFNVKISGDAKSSKSKNPRGFIITRKNIESHLGIIISCRIVNPRFDSQSKTRMTEPKVDIGAPDLTEMLSWNFIASLKYLLNMKEMNSLSGTKSKVVLSDKLSDAGWAGDPKRSDQTYLVLVEGDSAKDLALRIFNDRDRYGVMPLKGKPLNLTKATVKDIIANKEVGFIMQTLGLKLDKEYLTSKDIKSLRYGGIIIFTDRDRDGEHIGALIMNMINELSTSLARYPGFISQYITPIVQLKKGSRTMPFYTLKTYDKYRLSHDIKGWTPKYYKGLASYDPRVDIVDIVDHPHLVTYIHDDDANLSLQLAFGDAKGLSDQRKLWVSSYEGEKDDRYALREEKSFSDFINYEYINCAHYVLARAIPSIVDSFKRSQRMIAYAGFQKFGSKNDAMNVANFGGYVSEICDYPHGQESLHGTIIGMAQSFTGSNNIPIFYDEGSFGSRITSKAGAARYIKVKLNSLMKHIYRKEDDCILQYEYINEHVREPKCYYPIIPMLLINGEKGMAVGYSTDIPSYNPLDVIAWIKVWINQYRDSYRLNKEDVIPDIDEYPEMIPWYRGFKGPVYMKGSKVYTEGIIEPRKYGMKISELPIGLTVKKFKERLDTLYSKGEIPEPASKCDHCGSKKVKGDRRRTIEDFETRIKFKIAGIYDMSLKRLGLISSNTYTNMTVLNEHGSPVIYHHVYDILNDFCNIRMDAYQRRKRATLELMMSDMAKKTQFYRFIEEVVIHKTIKLKDRIKAELKAEMESKGYPSEFLKRQLSSLTRDKMQELEAEIRNIEAHTDAYQSVDEEDIWSSELDQILKAYES